MIMITNHAQTHTALLLSSKSNRSAKKMKSPEGKTLADMTQYSHFLIHMGCCMDKGAKWNSKIRV